MSGEAFVRRTGDAAAGSSAACEDCGAPLGGRAGCEQAFHELGARAASDARFAHRRRAVVDAYALQHPAFVRSLKSLAAHLCGLCAAVERGSDPRAERAIWHDLSLPHDAVKPPLSAMIGPLTIAEVALAQVDALPAAIDAWIDSVWAAWAEHHALARRWLDEAIAARERRRRR